MKAGIPRNTSLLLLSLFVSFALAETACRVFDPFPYIGYWEINATEHGNLSEYDETLGWKGIPSACARFITSSSRTLLQHNSRGFRDIEHDEDAEGREAIVFLGDSFTWGYGVEFDAMFVNILRRRLPRYDIFNLSHRGYGTDQELLVFNRWKYGGRLKLVILMFAENDISDNNAAYRYKKYKPAYKYKNGRLTLTNLPVPKEEWEADESEAQVMPSLRDRLKWLFFQSQFIYRLYTDLWVPLAKRIRPAPYTGSRDMSEDTLTAHIISKLKDDVSRRGGRLIVVAIPPCSQFTSGYEGVPYQLYLKRICADLKVDYLDLTPAIKKSFFRTYYRHSIHLNGHGNRVVAKAIYDYLKKTIGLNI